MIASYMFEFVSAVTPYKLKTTIIVYYEKLLIWTLLNCKSMFFNERNLLKSSLTTFFIFTRDFSYNLIFFQRPASKTNMKLTLNSAPRTIRNVFWYKVSAKTNYEGINWRFIKYNFIRISIVLKDKTFQSKKLYFVQFYLINYLLCLPCAVNFRTMHNGTLHVYWFFLDIWNECRIWYIVKKIVMMWKATPKST